MLDRELTYQMPYERLIKLSRTATHKAFAVKFIRPVLDAAATTARR